MWRSPATVRLVRTGLYVVDAMTVLPVTATPTMSVRDVAALMDHHKVGSVLVREGHELLGIVTESDYVRRVILEGYDPNSTPISHVMTKDIVTVGPGMDIFDALLLMKDSDIHHLPVVDDGRLIGFVTMKDILKVQPDLLDNVRDLFVLREEDRKPIRGREATMPVEEAE